MMIVFRSGAVVGNGFRWSFANALRSAGSPRDRAVFIRKCAIRALRADECQAHGLARALFDGSRPAKPVQVRRGEAGAGRVDLG